MLAVPHGAPHDLAQHVATPFVAGMAPSPMRNVIAREWSATTRIEMSLSRLSPYHTGQFAEAGEQRHEQVGVVFDCLFWSTAVMRSGAPCPCRWTEPAAASACRRRCARTHEHVVPDLPISGSAPRTAAHEVDPRAASTGGGVAHLPEVVVGAELHDADPARTSARCRIRPASRGMPFSPLKMETTSRSAGIFHTSVSIVQAYSMASGLEVVAEREVAEHLEEGVMAQRRSDVVEVVVLCRRRASLSARLWRVCTRAFAAEEHVLELVHARALVKSSVDRRRGRGGARRCGDRSSGRTRGTCGESWWKSGQTCQQQFGKSEFRDRVNGLW